MANNPCPVCGKPIAIDDLNMAQGVGLCRACGKLSKLAEIVQPLFVQPPRVEQPPNGCSYTPPVAGDGTVIYASMRSIGSAIGLVAMSLFWNGIVSIFVLFALAGTYRRFIGPVPEWFPVPKGKDTMTDTLGGLLFLWLFLTPFIAIGTAMLAGVFLCVAGRIEVTIHDTFGRIRTGVGPLNWTRRFDPTTVKRVAVGETSYESNGRPKRTIKIEAADRSFGFASMLPDYRREWLMNVLHLLLVAPGKEQRQRLGLSTHIRN